MATYLERPSERAHWYQADGTPQHDIENASRPGETRPVTVRDARKLGLFPSVTSVLSVISKPGLERWKIEQAILAALTLPRIDGEHDSDFAARVVADSKRESEKAIDFGTRLHAEIESYLATGGAIVACDDAELRPFIDAFAVWHKANTDCFTSCVADFKTQNWESGPAKFWPEWIYQLAAYRNAILDDGERACEKSVVSFEHGYAGKLDYFDPGDGSAPVSCVSIVVSSRVPGMIEAQRWSEAEAGDGLSVFLAALSLWKVLKKYNPVQ